MVYLNTEENFMNRRVNISYSVELEEIPEHISDLINKVYNTLYRPLDNKFNYSLDTLKKDNEKETLKTIDEIRQQMFKIDCCLSDSYDILKDYQKASFDPAEELVEYETYMEDVHDIAG